ncbi:DUF2589 domain-containing protein [Actinomadura sp. WMMB 499]|uniref:DUF2589 domain-containing protein n=1 Tax=Actinomadura sp. WMMB 499 TaxID=1219491 RepID=UPI00124605E0|nr:DUF2589 domain-containing protein [Actinomadura sp. WMMB 499]QFG21247.1 DUF2589 domain-containing protein [Actinomadura sp. WMMB 499]
MPADLGRELALPFEQIIGGPLQGVIKGSVMSSSATTEFIEKIGLTKTQDGKIVPVMVNFTVDRWKQAAPGQKATAEKVEVQVPLLTLVPVPFLRLTKTTLDFEVKIQSTTVEKEDKQLAAEAAVSTSFWGISASFKGSYESKSAREDTTNRSATLGVHVEAVQDAMPKGMERMLSLLEHAIYDGADPTTGNQGQGQGDQGDPESPRS